MTTILSAGKAIQAMLIDSPVRDMVTKIFPLVSEKAPLPYISYRRAAVEATPTRENRSAKAADIEVACFAKTYTEAVAIAEAVCAALDWKTGEAGGILVRGCWLTDAAEEWTADAFMQTLTFRIRI